VSPRLSPRRRTAVLAAVVAAGMVAAGTWLATGSASAGSLSGNLYRDPNSAVVRWVAANPNDPRTPAIRDKIASQPAARWLASFNPSTIQSEVSAHINAANNANQVPVFSVYEIPNRDCGGASAGGAPDLTQYQNWISLFSQALGTRLVIIVLETDSLALTTCLDSNALAARNRAISTAVQTIKSRNANAKVYLDGGHSTWNSASDQANRLRAAGVQFADGFYTNVSNFNPTANEVNYGRAILSALSSAGVTGKRQIIDTSRNGGASGDWCADDNTDRRLGLWPTLNTGDPNVDGYLWVKPPGEADGCAFQAGSFQPQLASSLAQGVPNPPGTTTPPVTTTTPPRTTTPPVTTTPTRTTTAPVTTSSPPMTTSSPPVTGVCSATMAITNSWPGGFQADVTVRAGNAAISGWTVRWNLSSGQTISQLWNGAYTVSGSSVTVRNLSWNGSLAAGATAAFGLTANGSASTPALTCTSP
jgi:endoglucanase